MTDKELRENIIKNGLINEDDEVLLANGYADAFIGITDLEPRKAVYDKNKMIEIVMREDKCDMSEAIEWLEFNTWCAFVGDSTPLYINTLH